MERKDFIKSCGYICVGGAALAMLLDSCASTNYFAQADSTGSQIVMKKTEFLKVVKDKNVERKYVLVKSEKFNFPICVYKTGGEKYSALLMQCTHNGCELQPQASYLVCPCHGSEFSNQGVVQNPPAEQNLQTFKILTDHEHIYIQL